MDTGLGFLTIVLIVCGIVLFNNGKETFNAKCGFNKDQTMPIGLAWQEGLYGNVPCQRPQPGTSP